MGIDVQFTVVDGWRAFCPPGTDLWNDPTIHALADQVLAAPTSWAPILAPLLKHVRAPVANGDRSFLTNYQRLAKGKGTPFTPVFETAVLDFCWAAEDRLMFRNRKGVLFELILFKATAPRYQAGRGWARENVKVAVIDSAGRSLHAEGDLDIAAWSGRQQEGEFYSAKFQGDFEELNMTDLAALDALLRGSGPIGRVVVGAWALTRTRTELQAYLGLRAVSMPTRVRLFGFDDLAHLPLRMP
jgi:hypothetical protein